MLIVAVTVEKTIRIVCATEVRSRETLEDASSHVGGTFRGLAIRDLYTHWVTLHVRLH